MSEANAAPATSSKLIVHHLNDSRSQRVLWLLEELEVPYEIKKWERTKEQSAPEGLKAVHPLGLSPVIQDGDVTVAESGAIIEYLIGKYGSDRFTPSEANKIENLYFTHYAEGTLMPILVNKFIFNALPQRAPFLVRPIVSLISVGVQKEYTDPRIKMHVKYIEDHLAKKPETSFFVEPDRLTSADFQMIFPMESIHSQAVTDVPPRFKAYVERMHARPAYMRALEKGGEYNYAKL